MKTAIIFIALCLVMGTLAANSKREAEIAKCDVCQFVVKVTESYVKKDTTKAKVLDFLKKACKLSAGFKAQCEQIIDAKGGAFIDLILKKLPAEVVCRSVKLCDAASSDALSGLTMLSLPEEEPVLSAPPSKTCSLCEFVIKTAESYIASNATETEVLKFLEQACAISGPYADQCKQIIEAKGPEVFAFILKKENPQVLCSQLTLCAAPSVQPNFSIKAGGLCPECEFVVQIVEGYVTKNTTEKQIIAFLDKACALAPAPYNSECTAIVNSEGPKLLEDLIKKENPEKVCEQIKLCPKPPPSPAPPTKVFMDEDLASGSFCSTCEFVIKTAESYISSNSTETEILKFLESACSIAGPYAATCKAAVDSKGPELINWIIQKENPEAICSALTLCAKAPAPSSRSARLNLH